MVNGSSLKNKEAIVRYDYDPRRAAQLIEGLGYSKGADGFYRDAAGQVLGIESRTIATADDQVKVQLAMASDWQQLGIRADAVTFPQQRSGDSKYRATRPGLEVLRFPAGIANLSQFYGRNAPVLENRYSGSNRPRYRNPELDALIDRVFTHRRSFPTVS